MSLKTTLRTAHTAYRTFSTSSRHFDTPQSNAGPSNASGSGTNPFLDLQNLLSGTTSSPSSLPIATATASTAESAIQRGYLPRGIPPKVDPVLSLFTNMIMRHGEKGIAQKRMNKVLDLIRETSNQTPLPLLHRAVLLGSPSVKVLVMRKSMKSVPTPRALNERQRTHQSIAWILKAAEKGRTGVARPDRIAREILAILEGNSDVFKWLEQRHKEATLARSNITAR